MGKTYDHINDKLRKFIEAQKVFFVATAPMLENGHVNVSPKGYDSFKIIDDNTVAYVDLGGSGIETLAHLKENGRITIMFMAFEGKANILRLYGKGEAVSFDDPGFDELMQMFPGFDRVRSVIKINVHKAMDSCGFGVPFYEFKSERDQLMRTHRNKELQDWREYRYDRNPQSLDGLEGLVKPKT
jgi:hypothetical protein